MAVMTQPANIAAIEKATDTSWAEWLEFLEGINAKDSPHKEIAERVYAKLKSTNANNESNGWWAQGIAVAYEQYVGRRQPGQRSDGMYGFSVTKTMSGTMDEAMQTWLRFAEGRLEFSDVAIAKSPTTSQTDKRRHWGCGLADGTSVSVDASPKTFDKALLAITHEKLSSQKAADHWKIYWKSVLETPGLTR